MDFHLQHHSQKPASNPHRICCFLLNVQEHREEMRKSKWAQHKYTAAFTWFNHFHITTDSNIPGPGNKEKQYMWERKANTATVITQDWVLIVESLFPTFVKTTTGKKVLQIPWIVQAIPGHKLNVLWILLPSIFNPGFQCVWYNKLLCYLTGKQVFLFPARTQTFWAGAYKLLNILNCL